MAVLWYDDDRFADHDTGANHPERPSRLRAAFEGVQRAGLRDALIEVPARPASDDELRLVHPVEFIAAIEQLSARGGGHIDADTVASAGSALAARLAAGAGIDAVERLDAAEADSAFLAVRPPGHHATATRSMGFCLFNSAAVVAAQLAARGERVLIVDIDAHHGNGTQDIFYERSDVAYVSLHQRPLYPGTGAVEESGAGDGLGATVNVPMPPFATGDHYRDAVAEVVAPFAEAHRSTWLIISSGFDAHRRDPLTDLALTSGDFADITADLLSLVEPGRRLVYLEGGYDLAAVADSTAATVAAMLGERLHPEPPSAHGPGSESVHAAVEHQRRLH